MRRNVLTLWKWMPWPLFEKNIFVLLPLSKTVGAINFDFRMLDGKMIMHACAVRICSTHRYGSVSLFVLDSYCKEVHVYVCYTTCICVVFMHPLTRRGEELKSIECIFDSVPRSHRCRTRVRTYRNLGIYEYLRLYILHASVSAYAYNFECWSKTRVQWEDWMYFVIHSMRCLVPISCRIYHLNSSTFLSSPNCANIQFSVDFWYISLSISLAKLELKTWLHLAKIYIWQRPSHEKLTDTSTESKGDRCAFSLWITLWQRRRGYPMAMTIVSRVVVCFFFVCFSHSSSGILVYVAKLVRKAAWQSDGFSRTNRWELTLNLTLMHMHWISTGFFSQPPIISRQYEHRGEDQQCQRPKGSRCGETQHNVPVSNWSVLKCQRVVWLFVICFRVCALVDPPRDDTTNIWLSLHIWHITYNIHKCLCTWRRACVYLLFNLCAYVVHSYLHRLLLVGCRNVVLVWFE